MGNYIPLEVWDFRLLHLAAFLSSWSDDPVVKVGAIIARSDRSIVSFGINSFANGVLRHEERVADDNVRTLLTVSAEANAILAGRGPLHGATLFVAPFIPNEANACLIAQTGIMRVVGQAHGDPATWEQRFSNARVILTEAGVITSIVIPTGEGH